MRLTRHLFALAAIGAASALTHAAPAAAFPADVRIELRQVAGSGCPEGAASAVATPTGGSVVTFGGMRLSGAHSALRCTSSFTVTAPAGWTYALNRFRYEGDARLYGETSAKVNTTVNFTAGTANTGSVGFSQAFGEFMFAQDLPPDKTVYRPCDGDLDLHVGTSAGLKNATGNPSRLALSTLRVEPADLIWRACED